MSGTLATGPRRGQTLATLTSEARYGEHDVVTPIARGGTSGVYLAIDGRTGARVALKVLDPQLAGHPDVVDRFLAEMAVAGHAQHPGLLEIQGARHTPDGIPYLVMEYLAGVTLREHARRTTLSPRDAAAIGAQVAAALAALHAASVMHLDVKADNVIVIADAGWPPRIKVIDYGLSRRLDDVARHDTGIAGTPWCMAPEQWRGEPALASDVYGVGCLLYELVAGAPPFDGSIPELMTAHLERRAPRPSWLRPTPVALERVIQWALAKDPAARPTMAALAAALAMIADCGEIRDLHAI